MVTFAIQDNVSAASTTVCLSTHCCDIMADEVWAQSRAEGNERLKGYDLVRFVASSCCDQLQGAPLLKANLLTYCMEQSPS